jgi:hypothetical protein
MDDAAAWGRETARMLEMEWRSPTRGGGIDGGWTKRTISGAGDEDWAPQAPRGSGGGGGGGGGVESSFLLPALGMQRQ